MTVARVMGLETEYGVFCPDRPDADSAELSGAVLAAVAADDAEHGLPAPVRWDYSGEQAGLSPGPEWVARLTAQEQRWYRGSSLVRANGGRLYVDHGHPEHCTPEVTSPRAAVRHDLAGDRMMARASDRLAAEGSRVLVHKNNIDGKGAAYGTHENYLVDRGVPFDVLREALVPFLVTRAAMCGAGRAGIGPASEQPGFQLWQRADYIERVTGLSTTVDRPIVNTRDEPLADPARWRRLHVITGDATTAQVSTLLKLGPLALVLWVLERRGMPPEWAALRLADPVGSCRAVSRDLTLRRALPLADGRALTAVEVQLAYLEVVERELAHGAGDDPVPAETDEVRALWRSTLERLADDPVSARERVEWVARHVVLGGLLDRAGVGWDDPRAAAADLQWADVRPGRGLAARLTDAGHLQRLIPEAEVTSAVASPPETTRAWLRGEAIRRYGDGVFAAGWDSLVLDTGRPRLVRLPLPDPLAWSRSEAGPVLDAAPDPASLLTGLTGGTGPPGE